MADITPNDQQGAWMPFDVPRGAHRADPFASADRSLCWADDWTPYIITALKVLTRPETWSGTEDAIKDACLGGQALIAGISDSCGSPTELPFACLGDFTAFPSPFSDWTIDTWGTWIDGQGYGPTLASSGGTEYYGEQIRCTFDNPLHISNLHLVYDLVKGVHFGSATYWLQVYDVTNGHNYVLKLNTDLVDGDGQVVDTGVWTFGNTSQILINLFSDNQSGSLVPVGNSRIVEVDISGTYPVDGSSPC